MGWNKVLALGTDVGMAGPLALDSILVLPEALVVNQLRAWSRRWRWAQFLAWPRH